MWKGEISLTDKKRIQIYIDEDIYNIIKENAERERRSLSNYTSIIVEEAIKKDALDTSTALD